MNFSFFDLMAPALLISAYMISGILYSKYSLVFRFCWISMVRICIIKVKDFQGRTSNCYHHPEGRVFRNSKYNILKHLNQHSHPLCVLFAKLRIISNSFLFSNKSRNEILEQFTIEHWATEPKRTNNYFLIIFFLLPVVLVGILPNFLWDYKTILKVKKQKEWKFVRRLMKKEISSLHIYMYVLCRRMKVTLTYVGDSVWLTVYKN